MKLAKSLLLGTAAGLATVAGAQAADLPSRKAAPVEYVRVCSTYGAGFYYIPGTDTCIRVGGRARFEYEYDQPFSRNANVTGMRGLGRLFLDARTATEYGLLRAFVRVDLARRSGVLRSGNQERAGRGIIPTGPDMAGNIQTYVELDRAFVQLGGLTAGRTQSFFDFYAGDLEFVGSNAGSSMTTQVLAYTASFGGGFSASLSIEDPIERRNLIAGAPVSVLYPGYNAVLGVTAGTQPYASGVAVGSSNYAGANVPDVVGVLRYEGGWGVAQLSGAIHQVRSVGAATPAGVVGAAVGYAPDASYGYAINAGVKFNLPMIAPGDQLWLQGTYTYGASSYVISNPYGWQTTGLAGIGQAANLNSVDAVIIGNGGAGKLELTTVWGLTAAFLHYWTPTVRQAVFGSYMRNDFTSAATAAMNAGTACAMPVAATAAFNPCNGYRDSTYWTIGSNVIWSPVKDLDIGLELFYKQVNASGSVFSTVKGDPANTATSWGKLVSSDGQIVTRFRIQRDF